MTRLDQLSQPTRRHGEHIRAVIERERQQQIEANCAFEKKSAASASTRNKSRSLSHLAHERQSAGQRMLHQFGNGMATKNRPSPLRKTAATKSMTQLVTAKLLSAPKTAAQNLPTVVRARKFKPKSTEIEIDSRTTNVSVAGVFVSLHSK